MTAVDIIRAHRSGLINNETMAAALAGDVRALAYTQYKLDGNDGPASPPEGWQAEVTAETLTDEEADAGRSVTDEEIRAFQRLDLCSECICGLLAPQHHHDQYDDAHPFQRFNQSLFVTALHEFDYPTARLEARARIAAAINARREGSK